MNSLCTIFTGTINQEIILLCNIQIHNYKLSHKVGDHAGLCAVTLPLYSCYLAVFDDNPFVKTESVELQ